MWRAEGETVGIVHAQTHLPTIGIGEIVGKEEREVQPLVCRAGEPLAIDFLMILEKLGSLAMCYTP